MSPTIHHKYKYFHSTVQRAKDRRQKFHFCRLPFGVMSSLISLLFDFLPCTRLTCVKFEFQQAGKLYCPAFNKS